MPFLLRVKNISKGFNEFVKKQFWHFIMDASSNSQA